MLLLLLATLNLYLQTPIRLLQLLHGNHLWIGHANHVRMISSYKYKSILFKSPFYYKHWTKKWSFPLRISSVNVTKVSCGSGHIYWKNPSWKTSLFVQWSFSNKRSCHDGKFEMKFIYPIVHIILIKVLSLLFKFSINSDMPEN